MIVKPFKNELEELRHPTDFSESSSIGMILL